MAQHFTLHPTHPQPRLIRQAAEILRKGGLMAYPTDSSYALGCLPGSVAAAQRIRTLRGLDQRHFLTLVCRDLADVGRYARLDNRQFRVVRRGTPGGFTFIVPATADVPRRLKHPRRSTVGVRVPDHPVVLALLGELGEPILSSTLVLPGASEPLNDPEEIRARLGGQLDLVLDAGACPAVPTTVIDLEADPAVIVRQGLGDPARLGLAPGAPGEVG